MNYIIIFSEWFWIIIIVIMGLLYKFVRVLNKNARIIGDLGKNSIDYHELFFPCDLHSIPIRIWIKNGLILDRSEKSQSQRN